MTNVKNNIIIFYLFTFFRELMFIIPILVLFYQQNGLTLAQVMITQSVFALSIVIFEVPTGVIADKVGRTQSITLGGLTLTIAALTYSLGHSFYQFLFAEFIWGIGVTFLSGADSALIYDTLLQTKNESKYKKVIGRLKSIKYIAAGLGAIIGGYIALYGFRVNYYLTVLMFLTAFIISLFLVEPNIKKKGEEKKYLTHTIECLKESFSNKNLLFLLLFDAIFLSFGRIIFWFYQPYLDKSGVPIIYFGIVWAGFNLFAILGSNYSHEIEEKLKEKNSLWLIVLATPISAIIMGYNFTVICIILIFIQQFIRGFQYPVISDYTNKHLDSRKRATLLSIQSLFGSVVFAVLGPIYGFIADNYSLGLGITFSGASMLILLTFLMIWKEQKN